jgi:hypothetical protein
MDNTQDWMDDVTEILDQYAANERRLQGLPAEDKPEDSETEPNVSEEGDKYSEDKPKVSEQEAKDFEGEPKVSEGESKVFEEKADVSEVEPEEKELDEDGKEELRKENKNMMQAFVVSVL